MKQAIRQIKQKRAGLNLFSLFLILVLALAIWSIGKIRFTNKGIDLTLPKAHAQGCWTVSVPPGGCSDGPGPGPGPGCGPSCVSCVSCSSGCVSCSATA